MSVVIRCPNCGTTRATLGECEACGEAQTQFFCTNHEPGFWLEAARCPQCGARFGERAPRAGTDPKLRTTVPPPRKPVRPHPPLVPVRSRPTPIPDEPGSVITPPWQTLLASVLRARSLSRHGAAERDARRGGPSIGGCLRRLLLIAVLLFVVGLVIAFLFGRALLQSLQLN